MSSSGQADPNLTKSEPSFRSLAELCPDAILVIDGDRIVYANPAAVALLRTGAVSELIGRSPFDFVRAEYHDLVRQRILHVINQGQRVERIEFRWRRFDGAEVEVEVFAGPAAWDGAQVAQVIGRDISERKRAVESQRESEARLEQALDAADAGIWSVNPTTGEFAASDRALEMHGLPPGTLMTHERALACVHPEDRAAVEFALQRTMATGESFRIELRAPQPDGSIRWLASYAKLHTVGDHRQLIGLVQDITKRKKAKEAFREKEEQLELIVRHYPGMVARVDRDLRYVYASPRYADWFGIPASDILGRTIADVIGPSAFAKAEPLAKRALAGEQVTFENQILLSSGRNWWVLVTFVPVKNGDGTVLGLFIFAIDISERKQAEVALRESQGRLEADADALMRLNAASTRIWRILDLNQGLNEMLAATIELLGAEKGNVQLLDDDRQALTIAAQHGFEQEFLDFFRDVSTRENAAYGRALRSGERIVIEDVESDVRYAPYRALARTAGYRGVQSTPLVAQNGRPLGMLSTHWRQPHRPSDRELRWLDLCAHQTVAFIERCRLSQSLRRSDILLRAATDNAAVGLVMLDRNRRFIFANHAYCKILKLPCMPNELIGKGPAELLPEVDANQIAPHLDRAFAGERVSYELTRPSADRDGEKIAHYFVVYDPKRDGPAGVDAVIVTIFDITERKQAELELFASEERLRLAVRAANVGLWDWDLKSNTVTYSPEWKSQLGYLETEVRNTFDEWEKRVHPDDLGPTLDRIRSTIEGPNSAHEVEFRMRHKNKSWRWIFARAEVIREVDGTAVRMLGCHLDITDRKRVERVLHEKEELQRAVLASLPAQIAVLDHAGRIIAVNPPWEQFALANGGTADRCCVGANYLDACRNASGPFADEAAHVIGGLQSILNGAATEFCIEYPCHWNGNKRWFFLHATRLQSEDGGGAVLSHTNITDRVQADQKARQNAHRLQAILTTAADAIITIDDCGIVESVNPAVERMFGYAAAEMIGQNVKMFMPSPYREKHDGYLARYLRTREKHIIGIGREVIGCRKNGTVFPADLAISEVDHLGLFTGIIRDISKRKELEREIVEIASLEQRRIGQDLHDTVSQELTALGIRAAELAETLGTNLPSNVVKLVEKIVHGIQRSKTDLRAVMRGLLPVPVDADGLMAALSELADLTQHDNDIACTFVCTNPVTISDNVTATHLYLIAQEAVHNAIKHAKPKKIRIHLELNQLLTLSVEDDGAGIRKGDRKIAVGKKELMPPVPPSHTATQGLGLRIMHNRATIIGATLTAEPLQPTGTRVVCTLPRLNHGTKEDPSKFTNTNRR